MTGMTPHDDWENFGIWSASKLAKVQKLLASLGARTEVYPDSLPEGPVEKLEGLGCRFSGTKQMFPSLRPPK